MNKLLAGSFVAVLVLASSCGGSEKDPAAATQDTTENTSPSSAGSVTPTSDAQATSDDNGGASSSQREALLELMVEQAALGGIDFDMDCLTTQLDKLADEDVELIVAAGVEGDPDVSDEAGAIGDGLAACFTGSDTSAPGASPEMSPEINELMVDAMVEALEGSGMNVDRDCIADALEGLSADDLASAAAGTPTPEFIQQFMSCVVAP